jgi:hypothetical protein
VTIRPAPIKLAKLRASQAGHFACIVNRAGEPLGELLEAMVPLKTMVGLKGPVVEYWSSAAFLADALRVPGTDHFTIAKPKNAKAIKHRMLKKLISDLPDS